MQDTGCRDAGCMIGHVLNKGFNKGFAMPRWRFDRTRPSHPPLSPSVRRKIIESRRIGWGDDLLFYRDRLPAKDLRKTRQPE